ncbi:MAG: oligosaccharide flippase family protein [Sphingomonadales bacterium]|nr:oligosaccharide flippase family protein [Sphingomonadales bacterium]MBU3993456.1 oligosaccharide flippase family protein [Alphaproteobacteria bacterium]
MSVRGAAAWAMGGQYLAFAIQFVSSVVISRLFLAPAEVGLFSIALAAAMMVAILQDFGLTRYVAGLLDLDADEIARCSSVAVAFSWAIGIAIALGAPALAAFYGQPGLAPILWAIALSYLFSAFAIVPSALLSREMAFSRLFVVNVGAATVQAIVAIGLAMAGYSALALAWAMVAAAAMKALLTQAMRPALPLPPRFDGLSAVLRFGSQSSYLFVIGAIGSRSADLIVGKFLSLAATGIYTRSTGLATQLRALVSGAIGSVLYPALARLKRQGESLAEPYLRIVACFTATTWPAMAGLAIGAEPLVGALFGPRWLGVVPILQLIAIGEMLFEALPLQMEIPILHGEMRRLTRRNLVDTAASISLLIAGALISVEMAAASRIAYGAIWFLIYLHFVCGLIGLSLRRLVPVYAKSLAATAAAVMPLLVAAYLLPDYSRCGLATLAGLAGLGALFWLAALWLLRHPLHGEIVDILAGLRLRRQSRLA